MKSVIVYILNVGMEWRTMMRKETVRQDQCTDTQIHGNNTSFISNRRNYISKHDTIVDFLYI